MICDADAWKRLPERLQPWVAAMLVVADHSQPVAAGRGHSGRVTGGSPLQARVGCTVYPIRHWMACSQTCELKSATPATVCQTIACLTPPASWLAAGGTQWRELQPAICFSSGGVDSHPADPCHDSTSTHGHAIATGIPW